MIRERRGKFVAIFVGGNDENAVVNTDNTPSIHRVWQKMFVKDN